MTPSLSASQYSPLFGSVITEVTPRVTVGSVYFRDSVSIAIAIWKFTMVSISVLMAGRISKVTSGQSYSSHAVQRSLGGILLPSGGFTSVASLEQVPFQYVTQIDQKTYNFNDIETKRPNLNFTTPQILDHAFTIR